MDWNDLRYFLAVARAGTTSAAARSLVVNQSTVVRRLTTLEAALGVQLFYKRRDGYHLTPEGERLMPDAAAVETAVLSLKSHAASLEKGFTETLRVTTAEGMALGLVPQLINEFHRQNPGIRISLLIEDRYQDLASGEAEVALRAGPPGSDNLVGRKLSNICWAVYASQGYLDRAGTPALPEAINDHKVVGFEGPIEHIKPALWLRRVAPRCEIVSRSSSVLGLLFAAQSGFGLAVLPCHIGDPEPTLVRVVDPLPGLTGDFWMLTHPRLHKQSKVRAFFDFMSQEIGKYHALLRGETREKRDIASSGKPIARPPARREKL
ncbi:MAG: LysR family transcriptional regulator [Kiloniellaceae bacterium]